MVAARIARVVQSEYWQSAMTLWLTEQPATTAIFLPAGLAWSPAQPDDRRPVLTTLGDLFCPGRDCWIARTAPASGDERVIVLIDTAGDSQFNVLLRALQGGAAVPDRLICLALTGTGFRGQRQRAWSALRGNMHLTAHYRVMLDAVASQAALTMIPAVASAEAIIDVSQGRLAPRIKWVNDVMVRGAKVSGVLTATAVSGATIDRVTFGIGMNIDHAPAIDPTPFVPEAGCLAGFDETLRGGLPAVFREVTHRLDELVELVAAGQPDRVFARYRERAGFIGEDVCIWPEGTEDWRATPPVYRGEVFALNPDLSLRVKGRDQPIRAGRMALMGALPDFTR